MQSEFRAATIILHVSFRFSLEEGVRQSGTERKHLLGLEVFGQSDGVTAARFE